MQPQIPEIRGCLTKPKKSQYFQAVLMYTDGAGHEVRKSKSTREARKSDAFLVMMQMIQDEKDLLKTAAPGTMLTDFLRFWLEEVIVKTVEETTWNGYRMNLENHIIPYFEPLQLRLKDVRPLHIDGFMEYALQAKDNGRQLKAASVQRFYANLKTALDYAQKKELIEYNPARMLKAPKAEQYEAQYLSIEQIAALWKGLQGHCGGVRGVPGLHLRLPPRRGLRAALGARGHADAPDPHLRDADPRQDRGRQGHKDRLQQAHHAYDASRGGLPVPAVEAAGNPAGLLRKLLDRQRLRRCR